MNVRDVMTTGPAHCTPDINLGAAVEILWNANCRMLPVIDQHEKVMSVITERDICIALGTRNRLPGEITVGEVATHPAICCTSADDVRSALAKMVEAKVRRDVVAPIFLKSPVRGNGRTSEDDISTLKNPLRKDSIERQQRRRPGTSI